MRFKELFLENKKKRSYSCLMLDCDDLHEEIELIQKEIKKEDIDNHEKENHITILYGLTTNNAEKVLNFLPNKTITYKIVEISLFENEDNDVLKFTIESEDLRKLNKKVSNKFYNENKWPDYKAHMTISYLKPGTGKKYLKLKSPLVGSTFRSSVVVFSDQDSEHTYRLLNK